MSRTEVLASSFTNIPLVQGRIGAPRKTISKLLLLIERRDVIRGCIALWLAALAPDFSVAELAEVAVARQSDLRRASVAILSTGHPLPSDDLWLQRQVAALQSRRRDLPLVLMSELPPAVPVAAVTQSLHLTGHISLASNMDIAEAMLRIIIAGEGSLLMPRQRGELPRPEMDAGPQGAANPAEARLTLREQAVLDHLKHGLPNKVIANHLGISPSTVKAHVHSIIAKLNVRNRTEAAVTRRTPEAMT